MFCHFCVIQYVVMRELTKLQKEDSVKQSTLEQGEKSVSRFVNSDRILRQLNFVGPILSVLNFGWITQNSKPCLDHLFLSPQSYGIFVHSTVVFCLDIFIR